jgi:hypothetical protein
MRNLLNVLRFAPAARCAVTRYWLLVRAFGALRS